MRQVGLFAAAGLYALDHNMNRIAADHANASAIARRLAARPAIVLDPRAVRTNIILFDLAPGAPDAATVVAEARERGLLVLAFRARSVRAVTHLDVTSDQCSSAAEILVAIAEGR